MFWSRNVFWNWLRLCSALVCHCTANHPQISDKHNLVTYWQYMYVAVMRKYDSLLGTHRFKSPHGNTLAVQWTYIVCTYAYTIYHNTTLHARRYLIFVSGELTSYEYTINRYSSTSKFIDVRVMCSPRTRGILHFEIRKNRLDPRIFLWFPPEDFRFQEDKAICE